MILFKSRLYREELLRWSLIFCLLGWAVTSTAWAWSKEEKTLLLGFDENGARIITDSKDVLLRDESMKFIKTFVSLFLNYDAQNHKDQIGKAADLMSKELWDRSKDKLSEVNQKLKDQPLSQSAEIESIDLIGENLFEVRINVIVRQRLGENRAQVKMTIGLGKRERTETNPWFFEVKEMKDELL